MVCNMFVRVQPWKLDGIQCLLGFWKPVVWQCLLGFGLKTWSVRVMCSECTTYTVLSQPKTVLLDEEGPVCCCCCSRSSCSCASPCCRPAWRAVQKCSACCWRWYSLLPIISTCSKGSKIIYISSPKMTQKYLYYISPFDRRRFFCFFFCQFQNHF